MTVHWNVESERNPSAVRVDGVPVGHVFEFFVDDDGEGEVWAYGTPNKPGAALFTDGDARFLAVRVYQGNVEVEW